jgi:hypothetical protein
MLCDVGQGQCDGSSSHREVRVTERGEKMGGKEGERWWGPQGKKDFCMALTVL